MLSWRLSNTLDAYFCVAALDETMNRYGVPGIFNTDQGSQFTGQDFTQTLKDAGVAISMDGKGRCMDNVFIEHLWRSVKWEYIYLRELETGRQARQALGNWFHFYNEQRPHTASDGRRPMDVCWDSHRPPRRHDHQPDYCLTAPPTCSTNSDQLIAKRVATHRTRGHSR